MVPTARRLLPVVTVVLLAAGPARAARLTVDAPEGCVDASTLNQEVADLVGRSLADVPDADFHLEIAPAARGKWHLKLQVSSPGAAPDAARIRELDANSCAELGDAAALAIAVSVRALAEPGRPAPTQRSALETAGPAPAIPRAEAAPRPPWRPRLTLMVAGDTGELPDTGVAVLAGAAIARPWVRLAATVGWLPPRDKFVTGGRGGQFQLVLAAADACLAPGWGAWTLLGCGGGEIGLYRASGLQVARPDARSQLWRAARVRAGFSVALADSVALVVDGTAVIPLARPAFVLDGVDPVYQPAAVAVRIAAGVELVF